MSRGGPRATVLWSLPADARAREVEWGNSWKWAATHSGGPSNSMWGINARTRSWKAAGMDCGGRWA
eukprot:6787790-Lingulodinium_polyedra.AAC.1